MPQLGSVQTLRNASKGGGGKQSVTAPSLLYYKNGQYNDIGGGGDQNFGNLRYVTVPYEAVVIIIIIIIIIVIIIIIIVWYL